MLQYIECDEELHSFVDADRLKRSVESIYSDDEFTQWMMNGLIEEETQVPVKSSAELWTLTRDSCPCSWRPVLVAYKKRSSNAIYMDVDRYKYDSNLHRKAWDKEKYDGGRDVVAWMKLPEAPSLPKRVLTDAEFWAREEELGPLWQRLIVSDD